MTDTPTRVDRIIRRFKDNPLVAVIIVTSMAIIGLGSLTDAIGKFLNFQALPASSPQEVPATTASPTPSPVPRETPAKQPEAFKPAVNTPTATIEIPDVGKAIGFRSAVLTSDLLVSGGSIEAQFERLFHVKILPAEHFYRSARILINQDVLPHFFLTAKVSGDSNIETLELQGRDVYFLLNNAIDAYAFYNSEENQTAWKPLPFPKDDTWNTLSLYQNGRQAVAFLNSRYVGSFSLWNSPGTGKVGVFMKANKLADAYAHLSGVAVYQFEGLRTP